MKTFYTGILFFMIALYCDAQIQEIVDGYTDKLSYRSGEVITFFTKHFGNQTSFDLKDFGGNIIPSTLPNYAFTTTITQPLLCRIFNPALSNCGFSIRFSGLIK